MGIREKFDLTGRVALITGGSRGLGLQIAHAYGEMGAKLAITARKAHELDAARQELEAQGYEVLVVQSDLSQFDTIPGVVDQVMQRYGQIDILVNNAGASWGAPLATYPLEAWQKVIDLNLTAMFRLTQEVANRSMLPRERGVVINIASTAGLRGAMGEMQTIAYNTSKAGVLNFTRAVAASWGPQGIRVNAIAPGWFPTKMSQGLLDKIGEEALRRIPLGRFGGEEDLMGAAVFLACDASGHVTGQYIAVDGGASAVG